MSAEKTKGRSLHKVLRVDERLILKQGAVIQLESPSGDVLGAFQADATGLQQLGTRMQLAQTQTGAATASFVTLEEEVALSGATTDSIIVIPNGGIVFNCAMHVTEAITGCTSFDLGEPGNLTRFGSGLSIALGSTNLGVIGPTAFYADTALRFTAVGGSASFSGGKVRVALCYYLPTAPTA